jgi:hypothetical protein
MDLLSIQAVYNGHFSHLICSHGFQQVDGNLRAPAYHGLQFESREEGEEGHGDDTGHALADCRHRLIKLVEPDQPGSSSTL